MVVSGYVDPFLPEARDEREGLPDPSARGAAGPVQDLQVRNLDADAGAAADLARLGDGLEHFSPGAADVAGVDAAGRGDDRGEGDQFPGLRVGAGNVKKPAGKSESSFAHRPGRQAFHARGLRP